MKKLILLVDDEPELRRMVASLLTGAGYEVAEAADCAQARAAMAAQRPDAVLLDVMLPDGDGFSLLPELRRFGDVPVLYLSARDEDAARLQGLGLGADDYITKPFSGGELLARIRTALRHAQAYAPSPALGYSETYHAGELEIDYDKRLVTLRGTPVHLTQSEYKIVSLLSRYSGKVLTYDFLLREIWGAKVSDNTQNLRAVLAKIRRKLEKNPAKPEYIFTEVGVGYRMRESESTP